MPCVFCAIVAGKGPAIRIYEDHKYLAILDIRPFTRGHTLVIPKQHTVDLTDTPPKTLADMVTIGQRIARAARATELADATNIGINDGSAAFQSVFHIHLHVLPRRNGDKLSVAKGLLLRRDPDREATARLLRDALAAID
ncbi:HIT family protein [Mycobacterium conspicuum]|jgi:diadenosine tetraphosphate (Ap4A) HIT family hydrolase|uniref:Hydrolase n=1 Tax=Mycobacterium conspicuum TaxID=44010 RepID=A0A1X1TBP8_9MYCO|nr:HIT family protein [Mycobacterium conspicuum]ORV41925.1 HIT family hydrolase [Mycobacterium conspicuum]BBZ40856.1 hydrolase [Mycobacterium conspicuum]